MENKTIKFTTKIISFIYGSPTKTYLFQSSGVFVYLFLCGFNGLRFFADSPSIIKVVWYHPYEILHPLTYLTGLSLG
jgi:hypothetical protein